MWKTLYDVLKVATTGYKTLVLTCQKFIWVTTELIVHVGTCVCAYVSKSCNLTSNLYFQCLNAFLGLICNVVQRSMTTFWNTYYKVVFS